MSHHYLFNTMARVAAVHPSALQHLLLRIAAKKTLAFEN